MAYAAQVEEHLTEHVKPGTIIKHFVTRRKAAIFRLWKGEVTVPRKAFLECQERAGEALIRPGVKRSARAGLIVWRQKAQLSAFEKQFKVQKRQNMLFQVRRDSFWGALVSERPFLDHSCSLFTGLHCWRQHRTPAPYGALLLANLEKGRHTAENTSSS